MLAQNSGKMKTKSIALQMTWTENVFSSTDVHTQLVDVDILFQLGHN